VFGDVLERLLPPEPHTQSRPVSRFRAARLAAKRWWRVFLNMFHMYL